MRVKQGGCKPWCGGATLLLSLLPGGGIPLAEIVTFELDHIHESMVETFTS
jgi:hypothetical protein